MAQRTRRAFYVVRRRESKSAMYFKIGYNSYWYYLIPHLIHHDRIESLSAMAPTTSIYHHVRIYTHNYFDIFD